MQHGNMLHSHVKQIIYKTKENYDTSIYYCYYLFIYCLDKSDSKVSNQKLHHQQDRRVTALLLLDLTPFLGCPLAVLMNSRKIFQRVRWESSHFKDNFW